MRRLFMVAACAAAVLAAEAAWNPRTDIMGFDVKVAVRERDASARARGYSGAATTGTWTTTTSGGSGVTYSTCTVGAS